jgi:hypothetical protein
MQTAPVKRICPRLGLSTDHTVAASAPSRLHRCHMPQRVLAPDAQHQEAYCLCENHINCPLYQQTVSAELTSAKVAPRGPLAASRGRPSRPMIGLFMGALLLVLLIAAAYPTLSAALAERRQAIPADVMQAAVVTETATPTPIEMAQDAPAAVQNAQILEVATETPTAIQGVEVALAPAQLIERFVTPTPVPGGEVFLIKPEPGQAGWWASKDTLRNHLGDSFLYAGAFEGRSYISGIRFDLSQIPRGAPIPYAQLRLTGLRNDRLISGVAGTWLVQLVPESSLADLTESDFLTFYSAPASITLFPQLNSADLAKEAINRWTLDDPTRQWLAQQLLDGATSVIVRILAGTQNGETLFAWDSGLGPETAGDAATLLLSVGAPPPTPPPLPTKPVIIATTTPVPANVMTVVAHAATATVEANAFGTNTPFPYQVVTPTPTPQNLATVQANALAEELPPVVLDTPVPQNEATATYNAEYATAVALTTGTFTPVPTNYVTPMLVYPSPPPENVATAAARVVQATQVAASGAATPTPLPYNAVEAIYAFATETPANQETAIVMVREQNAAAATTGTPTPTPWNLVVITAIPLPAPTEIPLPTAVPLIISVDSLTPTSTPAPTRMVTVADLALFRNKILFLSDRSSEDQVWVMDPDSGEVVLVVTDLQLMALARDQMLSLSPSGREQAIVQADNNGDLQIKIYSFEYKDTHQLTHFREKVSYDPAWSPRGDQIAFVSTNSGNDEIYLVDLEGRDPLQLTHNTWEWDKHPSWSPDGSRIVFYSNRDSGRSQIWIMNADGSEQRNLSNNEYNDWDPIWIR